MKSYRNSAKRRAPGVVVVSMAVALSVAGCASSLEQRFQAHIDYLASDELEGRGLGSRGIKLAADYIAEQFAEIGLEPAGEEGTYFQTFPITLHRTLTEASRLAFEGDTVERRQGRDFIPFNFSSDESFSGDVVFCGYGIVAPEKEHDDFADVDLTAKVALMVHGEPPSWADENGYPTHHAMLRDKVYNAKDRGAVAVLIVNETPAEGQADELTEFVAEGAEAYGIPAFHITRSMADGQLAAAGLSSLAELQERLDARGTDLEPVPHVSADLPHVRASGQAVFKKNSAPTRNVLGLLRGKGPLAEESVVVGAHYDHLGICKPMARRFKAGKLVKETRPPQIHNGADDNASGTSGLIEVARMFTAGPPPKRSILFVAFTAEETGLHGSKHYIEHPAASLDETVAMFNMDMVGRMKPGSNTVQVFGVGSAKEFTEFVERAGRSVGLTIAATQDPGGRSDHAPFVRKEIPSMHFFTGQHADHHRPSDDSDKINARDGAKVATLVYRVARELAMRAERPTFQAVKLKKPTQPAGTPTYRVVMGIAPGYADDGKPGMAVDAVSPQGPADLSGMKAGDRIIRIDGKKVANIYDYMAALRDNNPGDTVEAVVLRDGREVILSVTLASAR